MIRALTTNRRWRRTVFGIALAAAAARLVLAFERLLFPSGRFDAGDLRMRWEETHAWFAGRPVYGAIPTADYPPAGYSVLWPFIGWTNLATARWIWAAITVTCLVWLVRLLTRGSGLPRGWMRAFLVLLPCVGYATYSTIVNGQASLLVVTCLTAGVLTLVGGQSWPRDLIGSLLVAMSLIKPTLSLPLVWVAFLAPGRLRPTVLIVSACLASTLLAAAFQPVGLVTLIQGWLAQRDRVATVGLDLQALLTWAGLQDFFLVAAAVVGAAAGYWVYLHRRVDVWLLLGVTAIIAMLWSYHRPYDDLMMWLPVVALVRVALHTGDARARTGAGILIVALAGLSIERPQLPNNRFTHGLLFTHVEAAVYAVNLVRLATWLAALAFLVREAHRAVDRRHVEIDSPAAAAVAPQPAGAPSAPSTAHATASLGWIAVCLGSALTVLAGAFAWLAVEHRTLRLWNVIVHESGHYTLGQTVLYFRHFLREIPTVLAMVLFVLASYAVPKPSPRHERRNGGGGLWVPALLAAAALVAISVTVVSLSDGLKEAALNLSQLYTRDDVSAFGSHWRFHWLSTLWFGLAAPAVAWMGYRLFGGPAAGETNVGLTRVAWSYFAGLTVIFGVGTEPFVDARFIGHQAREILTHGITTLPLGLGLAALVGRLLGVESSPGPVRMSGSLAARFAGMVAIPAYLGVGVLVADAMASGQTKGGLAAMVAAHFFEHSLDYVLAALLVVAFQAVRVQPAVAHS